MAFHCDGMIEVGLTRCWLMHDFELLDTYCEAKIGTCCRKLVHAVVHLRLGACIECAVISIEVSQNVFIDLGENLGSVWVERLSFCSISDDHCP